MTHKVYNWQIGRDMEYKYPAARPKRQATWIFDTNKCIACQTCTLACKNAWTSGRGQETMFWNNVETKPWGFYPTGWDVRILEKLGPQQWEGDRYTGKTLFESVPYGEEMLGWLPDEEDWAHPNLGEDEVSEQIAEKAVFSMIHSSWMFYLQRICNHCTYPACLAACSRKVIYKRPEDGIVLLDQNRCRGYQECVRGCPYKKSMYRSRTRKSEKCIACYPAVEKGLQTQCNITCIGRIRMFGFKSPWDRPRADNPVDYLIHEAKVALPLYPQFGLEPNVYYIPPIHVPTKFTRQMFGPGVDRAVERYRNAREDERLLGLLMLFGATDRAPHSFKVAGDPATGHCAGYDADGREIVRVPMTEPTVLRNQYDETYDVHRLSVT